MFHKYRSSRPKVFCKNDVLKASQNLQERVCDGVSFLKNSVA